MTAPKQPNLSTDDKQLIVYLLDQEYDQVNKNLRSLNSSTQRTMVNAHKVYKKNIAKVLNKIPNKKYSYGTDL